MPNILVDAISALDSRHPQYSELKEDWDQMRDTYRGSRIIKQRGIRYLPPTDTMQARGMQSGQLGYQSYQAYKKRAHFPGVTRTAIQSAMGVMHRKPPVIELPGVMAPMLKKATLKRESLAMLLRRINEEQLITGRLGLLLDMPEIPSVNGENRLYIAMYATEKVINWHEIKEGAGINAETDMIVLDESEYDLRDVYGFSWQYIHKYRVLALDGESFGKPKRIRLACTVRKV